MRIGQGLQQLTTDQRMQNVSFIIPAEFCARSYSDEKAVWNNPSHSGRKK